MSEAGRPGASTPLAADDMIGSLATRVRELSLRVAQLEGDLEAARRRIAVYEDFDAQVQDSLSTALRAANQIRERARVTGEAIAEEARAHRPAAVAELEAMRVERDALRRAIDDASSSTASARSAAPVAGIPMAEMRTAATEALRSVFKELVAEIRATPQTAPAPAAVQTPFVQPPVAAPSRPASSPAPFAPPSVYPAPPVQQPAATPPPPPASNMTAAPTPAQAPAPRESYAAPPSTYNAPAASPYSPPQAQPLPRPTIVPAQAASSPLVEDVDVAPAAAAAPVVAPPAPQPAPAPAAAQPTPEPAPEPTPKPTKEWTAQPSEPVGEVQVVLSPISSFPRLVELERRLQGMAVVRTVYARDFRNGVATLAIGLRHPMTVDEFATAVTKLEYPRLRIVSTSGYVLELRIDSEASIA